MTWFEIIKKAESILKKAYQETYKQELYSVLKFCFGMSKIDLLTKKGEQVESSVQKNFFDISEKIGQNRLTKAGGYGNIVNTSKRVYFFVPKNEGTSP